MAVCPNCRNTNPPQSRFCLGCGTALGLPAKSQGFTIQPAVLGLGVLCIAFAGVLIGMWSGSRWLPAVTSKAGGMNVPMPANPSPVRSDVAVNIQSWRYMEPPRGVGQDGKVLLVCRVSVKNNGASKAYAVSDTLHLTASDRQQYSGSALALGPALMQMPPSPGATSQPVELPTLLNSEVLSGGEARGDAVFLVDRGAEPVRIELVDLFAK